MILGLSVPAGVIASSRRQQKSAVFQKKNPNPILPIVLAINCRDDLGNVGS